MRKSLKKKNLMICKKESAESNDLSEMLTQLKKKNLKKEEEEEAKRSWY